MVMENPNSATVEPRAEEQANSAADSVVAELHDLRRRLEELGRYLLHYLTIKKDRLTRAAQRGLVWAAAGVIAAVLMLAFIATAGALLCIGIAMAISQLTGIAWLGPLATGLLVLLVVVGGAVVALWYMDRALMRRFTHKCQRRRAELRFRYGRGIDE